MPHETREAMIFGERPPRIPVAGDVEAFNREVARIAERVRSFRLGADEASAQLHALCEEFFGPTAVAPVVTPAPSQTLTMSNQALRFDNEGLRRTNRSLNTQLAAGKNEL